jgi:NitT/TauT family transport system ATP-binding protein
MNTILNIEKISLSYHTKKGEIEALKNITFDVQDGEFIAIIGPSGCGKTSILSIIAGLLKPSGGKVTLFDKEITKPNDLIGYMFQKDQLFPWHTIEKNIYLPLEIKHINSQENQKFANLLLKKYGLENFKKKYPNQLSGGMRQRVALIRTLVSNPKLLLLDEPFSALDSQTRLSVCDDVYRIIKCEKKTTVLVTHDISEAISMSDKIIVLTNRPAQVKSIFKPNIKGDSPLRKRESPEFSFWFEKILKELHL